jgi:hypothetical protein
VYSAIKALTTWRTFSMARLDLSISPEATTWATE